MNQAQLDNLQTYFEWLLNPKVNSEKFTKDPKIAAWEAAVHKTQFTLAEVAWAILLSEPHKPYPARFVAHVLDDNFSDYIVGLVEQPKAPETPDPKARDLFIKIAERQVPPIHLDETHPDFDAVVRQRDEELSRTVEEVRSKQRQIVKRIYDSERIDLFFVAKMVRVTGYPSVSRNQSFYLYGNFKSETEDLSLRNQSLAEISWILSLVRDQLTDKFLDAIAWVYLTWSSKLLDLSQEKSSEYCVKFAATELCGLSAAKLANLEKQMYHSKWSRLLKLASVHPERFSAKVLNTLS